MRDLITETENASVRKWFEENSESATLKRISDTARDKGYTYDPKAGLFFRQVYNDSTLKKLGYTVLDILFPRPADVHYHTDMGEAIRVVDGVGFYYEEGLNPPNNLLVLTPNLINMQHFIEKRREHSFSPAKNDYLEIRLCCTGPYLDENEIQVIPFNEFELWKKVQRGVDNLF